MIGSAEADRKQDDGTDHVTLTGPIRSPDCASNGIHTSESTASVHAEAHTALKSASGAQNRMSCGYGRCMHDHI